MTVYEHAIRRPQTQSTALDALDRISQQEVDDRIQRASVKKPFRLPTVAIACWLALTCAYFLLATGTLSPLTTLAMSCGLTSLIVVVGTLPCLVGPELKTFAQLVASNPPGEANSRRDGGARKLPAQGTRLLGATGETPDTELCRNLNT